MKKGLSVLPEVFVISWPPGVTWKQPEGTCDPPSGSEKVPRSRTDDGSWLSEVELC